MSKPLSPCFIVVRDETDYNGDRTYPLVCFSKEEAVSKIEEMRVEELVGRDKLIKHRWTPRFYVEESWCVRANGND